MSKQKKSGPAIFMDIVMVLTALIAIACFTLYYGNYFNKEFVLWIGITAFMILYHFYLRIFFGNITSKLHIHYSHPWFKEHAFEKPLYEFFKVKRWKGKALTYNPDLFNLENYSLEEIANTMSKAETDHWINELVSISSMLFGFVWGEMWIFVLTAILAMAFDGQFILIQRYNRPRIMRILKKQNKQKSE